MPINTRTTPPVAGRTIRTTARSLTIVLIVTLPTLGLGLASQARGDDALGPGALLDAAYALALLALTTMLAVAAGRRLLTLMRPDGLGGFEQDIIGFASGYGVLALGVTLIGLAGWLNPTAIAALLTSLAVITWRELAQLAAAIPSYINRLARVLASSGVGAKITAGMLGLIFLPSLVLALTPPFDYDGLMYHLQGPRLFLEDGGISLLPDLWQANGPLAVEMLFAIGLAFGSPVYAKVLHLSFTFVLFLATGAFARRFLEPSRAWLPVLFLLGVPALPLWGSLAYVDVAWGLFEFLGIYAMACWTQNRRDGWLWLAGSFAGLAMGAKYLALGGAAILGFWVIYASRGRAIQDQARASFRFALPALLLAAPWYLKNAVLTGNPFYPFIWGGPGWDLSRLAMLMDYLRGFGVGGDFWSVLQLPWILFARHSDFSTFVGIEFPNLLFLLALAYPFFRGRNVLDSLAWVTALRFIFWAPGSQQVRFLLPLFPALSLLSARVLVSIAERYLPKILRRVVWLGLPLGLAVVTLAVQGLLSVRYRPLPVLLGTESRQDYLARTVSNFRGLGYIREQVPPSGRVMMVWDGQGFYCNARCLPDADQTRWLRMVSASRDSDRLYALLEGEGITHVLYSEDAHLVASRDRTGNQARAIEHFLGDFAPGHTKEVYGDAWVKIFELVPDGAQE